nr:reverse transcriptase domain-containing protein [Tanacetum cinerariifolium]
MESVSFPELPPLIRTPEKRNLKKFCNFHRDKGHNTNDCYQLKKKIEEVMALRKLAHLMKDIRQNNQRNGNQGRNNMKIINMVREEGNHERPFEEGRSDPMNEVTFPAILQSSVSFEKTQSKEDIEEVFNISHERPDEYVMMGAALTTNCKQLLIAILWENMEDDGKGRSRSKRTIHGNTLGGHGNKKKKKEAEGLVMKKFFGEEEQVDGTPDANEEGTFTLSKKLQAKSISTPRA